MPSDTPAAEPLLVGDVVAARMASVSRATWRRLFVRGMTPAGLKLGRKRLWVKADIERWISLRCPDRATFEAIQAQQRRTYPRPAVV